MKKIIALVLAATMVMGLGACAKKEVKAPETQAETVEPLTQAAAESPEAETAAETKAAETKPAETEAEAATQPVQETIATEKPVNVHPIIVSDGQTAQYPDNKIAYTLDWGKLTLKGDEAKTYAGLEEQLSKLGEKIKTTVLADVDRFMETIKDAQDNGRTDLQEQVNETKVHAERSDSNFFSVRVDTFVDFGGAHPGTLIGAYNYDTKTGKQLVLGDIVADKDKFLTYVKEDLLNNYKKEEFFDLDKDFAKYQLDAAENAADDTKRAFTWLLGYDGIQIIFNQYDIAPYAAGQQFVDIKFADHPEFFKKGIELVPDSYVVQVDDSKDDAGYRVVTHNVKTKAGDFVWKLKFEDDDENYLYIYPAGSNTSVAKIPGGDPQTNKPVEADHPVEGLNVSQGQSTTEQVVDPYDFVATAFDRAKGKSVTKHYTLDDAGLPVEIK